MTENRPAVDTLYHHGLIYTADAQDNFCEAIALYQGVIVAVGSNEEILPLSRNSTCCIDLQSKVMLPGIIDSHMHPFWGGKQLRGCQLHYAALTVDETLSIIKQHLDNDPVSGEDDWLTVRAWQRQAMLPAGADMSRDALDTLNTRRPVVLFSNDCHTLAANSRALEMLNIDETTPVPPDGKIARDIHGRLTGILEDAPAMRAFDSIPSGSAEQNIQVATHVQQVLNQQGVTTVMDARVFEEQLNAYAVLRDRGTLTLRVAGAREVTPDSVQGPEDATRAIAEIQAFHQRWNDAIWQPAPGFSMTQVKFFIDGVLQPPTMCSGTLNLAT
ncbi:MAG: N-substituted formamide deformylase [Candidatus Erwinia impunctatus]|nr:N-substituted formamide deformylase [Culicoides impunctatus]